MRGVGINDRIDVVRAAEKARIEAADQKAADEEEMRRQRANEYREKAEALMPEVSEGVDLLRSKRERSIQLLGTSGGPIRLSWQPGRGWTARQREERREMVGWEFETRASPAPTAKPKGDGTAAHAVFIPLQGALRVIDGRINQPIDEHVRAGIVEVLAHEKRPTLTEVHAEKTVSRLLELLASHLALLH